MKTRERIIRAAERVMREKGLAHTTIREIAHASELSEGALYKHFKSKEELFLHVLKGSPSNFIRLIMTLPERAGTGTLEGNLEEVATSALTFYGLYLPIGAALFSEPELLVRSREEIRQRNAGPQKANEALTTYLRAEQGVGRLHQDVNPEAVANLLLGACFQRAFLKQFLGQETSVEDTERFVESILQTLMRSL